MLFGITGSGKTEVYLRAMQAALDDGRSALMLVPEIARLEPEAVAQFLEQTDLDPVTVFGATEEEVNSELVRASLAPQRA